MEDYEKSVSFLGTWGRFQRRVFLLLCLTVVPGGYNILSLIFLLATPTHHCHIPTDRNLSQDWIQVSIPQQDVGGRPERSSCSRYQLDLIHNLSVQGWAPQTHNLSLKQEGCKDGWTYSTEYYSSTVTTEFDLVCSNQWKQPLTSLLYFLGGLCGCFISGPISDRFGRKPVLFGSIAILTVFSGGMAFIPSWPGFTVLFFMLGLGQLASFVTAFVLGSELLIGPFRVLFSCLCLPFVYVFSTMLLPVTAYLVRDWRHLSLIMAVPGLACIPLWWLVPESPRWLVSCGRLQEAEVLLRSGALENQVEPPQVIFVPTSVEKAASLKVESLSVLDLVKTRNIRDITLILLFIWFSISVSYFGISFNMSGLDGNPFLNYVLVTAVEFPAYASSWLIARGLPRRLSFITFILLGALALLLIQISPHGNPALTLSLVLLGKFGIMVGYAVLYVYTGELYPTVIRNTAMASCATFSRMGSAVSPYLLQLAVFYQFLPWIIVGSLSLLSVLLCGFLPETLRQPLPDTIDQMPLTQRFRSPLVCKAKDDGKIAEVHLTSPEIICATRL